MPAVERHHRCGYLPPGRRLFRGKGMPFGGLPVNSHSVAPQPIEQRLSLAAVAYRRDRQEVRRGQADRAPDQAEQMPRTARFLDEPADLPVRVDECAAVLRSHELDGVRTATHPRA